MKTNQEAWIEFGVRMKCGSFGNQKLQGLEKYPKINTKKIKK